MRRLVVFLVVGVVVSESSFARQEPAEGEEPWSKEDVSACEGVWKTMKGQREDFAKDKISECWTLRGVGVYHGVVLRSQSDPGDECFFVIFSNNENEIYFSDKRSEAKRPITAPGPRPKARGSFKFSPVRNRFCSFYTVEKAQVTT